MFSSNNKISARQLNNLIVVDFLGLLGLLMPQIALHYSLQDGLIAIIYAIIISLIYTYIILLIKKKIKINLIDFVREKAGRLCSIIVGLFFLIKYFIFAMIVLYILGETVNTILLPEVNPIVVIGAMMLVSTYCVAKGIESRARLAEILYWIVLVPIILILVFSFRDVDKYNITPLFIQSQMGILKTSFILFFLFSPSEMLLFEDECFENNKKTRKFIYLGIITVGIINILIFAVNVGIFGVNGMRDERWPTVTLMQVVEFSGKFLERQDGIMTIFCIVSLFSISSALIYYIVLIVKKMFRTESTRRYGWISVLILFIAVSISMNGNYVWSMKNTESKRIEIEDREYVMALGIDKEDDEFSISYSFSDITSQSEDASKEDGPIDIFNCKISSIYEAENIYLRQSDKKLDFTHLKVVIIGSKVMEDKKYISEVVSYLKEESEFARNTNLCITTDTANKIISLEKNLSDSVGIYLQKMFTNNLSGHAVNIEDLISNASDDKKVDIIPILTEEEKRPAFTESVILKGLDVVRYCGIEETGYLNIIEGKGEGSIIDLLSYGTYLIENNDVVSDIKILSGRTIHLKLTYSGNLKERDTKKKVNEKQINNEIEEIMLDKLTYLRKDYNIDIVETHKLLGIYDRGMWRKYLDDEEGLFENLHVEVVCNFTIH